MRRLWIGTVLLAAGCCSAAEARAKHHSWAAVQRLAAGAPITVRSGGQSIPDRCFVLATDVASLTCSAEDVGGARLDFPRDAVREVWLAEPARDHHVGLWIAVGVGTGLGAAICSPGGARAAVFCAALGAGFASAIALNPPPRAMLYSPYGYPPADAAAQGPPLRMRLIYSATLVQPESP